MMNLPNDKDKYEYGEQKYKFHQQLYQEQRAAQLTNIAIETLTCRPSSVVSTCLLALTTEERTTTSSVEVRRIMRSLINQEMRQGYVGRKLGILVYLNICKKTRM